MNDELKEVLKGQLPRIARELGFKPHLLRYSLETGTNHELLVMASRVLLDEKRKKLERAQAEFQDMEKVTAPYLT